MSESTEPIKLDKDELDRIVSGEMNGIYDIRIYDRHLSEEEILDACRDSFISFPARPEMRHAIIAQARAENVHTSVLLRTLVKEGLERRGVEI